MTIILRSVRTQLEDSTARVVLAGKARSVILTSMSAHTTPASTESVRTTKEAIIAVAIQVLPAKIVAKI